MEFLRSVALAHMENYGNLDDFCFVFPNKRSGTFFRKYLRECSRGWSVSPEITTISDFVSDLSDIEPASRLDLLFLLYKEYSGMQSDPVDFDRFRSWGEMVLNDFNDVDMYEVDASALYKNLSDLREIRTDYFTEDQLEVLRDYFGITEFHESTRSFWVHYNNPDHSDDVSFTKRKFVELWKVSGELYYRFNDRLTELGLGYGGKIYRAALANLKNNGHVASGRWKKIVMVGFNALSTVEFHIFRELQKLRSETGESQADFYWDCTGAPMADVRNSAVHFIHKNKRIFPSSLDISKSDFIGLPSKIKVVSSPSNSVQSKIISGILADIRSRVGDESFVDAKVAVVLPDEGLLFPVMYSLPEDMKGVNLTMGYSMSLTSTVTFVELLRKLQNRKRLRGGKYEFFHEDVKNLLSHAYVQRVVGGKICSDLRTSLSKEHRFLISPEIIVRESDAFRVFFLPISKDAESFSVLDYLDTVLGSIEDEMFSSGVDSGMLKCRLDMSHIRLYRQSIQRMYSLFSLYGIDVRGDAVFSLVDSLIRGETVRFEGEPLAGLQIMGPLETRCLDFDYLVIPSMNERIYPRKLKSSTFIPNTLRRGYGIATTRFQESIFSYNFYRMISRAKEVYMIYDARPQGIHSGDVSRYVRQLELLYAPQGSVEHGSYGFRISATDEPISVRKSAAVMREINKYFDPEGGGYFSASTLGHYMECPLRFYLENVRHLCVDQEPEEFMEASVLGTILHNVLENIYTPCKEDQGVLLRNPVNITSTFLDDVISNKWYIYSLIRREINKEHYKRRGDDHPLEPDGEVYADIFHSIILRVLGYDRLLTPFLYYGSEVKMKRGLMLSDGSVANMKYIIDRIDSAVAPGKSSGGFRIVDYKSGSFNLKISNISDLFDADKGNKAFFQLMLYACLVEPEIKGGDGVRLEIYDLSQMGTARRMKRDRIPKVLNDTVGTHLQLKEEFMKCLDILLMEIKNPEKDFVQCKDSGHCVYCPFKDICRR